MVQIIGRRVPTQDNTAEPAVSPTLGSLFAQLSAPFMDTLTGDVKRSTAGLNTAKTEALNRLNAGANALADIVAQGQYDPAAAAAAGIRGGLDPKNVAGYDQYITVKRDGPASEAATRATMSVPGASYSSTVAGTREDLANRRTLKSMEEATKLRVAAQTPTTVLVDGVPTVIRQDQSYGKPASVGLSEQKGAAARTALSQPGGVDALSPAGQKFIEAAPSGDDVANASFEDGSTVPVFVKPDGLYDVQTGQKLTKPVVSVGKLAATTTEGLRNVDPLDKELQSTRTNTNIARHGIAKVVEGLQKPDADQAVGWLGRGATVLNNIRSQVEAGARLLGGSTLNEDLKTDGSLGQSLNVVTDAIASRPDAVARMQSLGIDSATLRSRIGDLAYMIAKARDPSGRMSNQDVEKAADSIGAALMDPKAGVAVLQDLDKGLADSQRIREEEITRIRSERRGRMGGAPSAPTKPIQQWGRGPDGKPMRVQ